MAQFDYEAIKRIAKENSIKTEDLLALSANNDPFYTGRPSEVEASRWFRDLWRQFGYHERIHLRRIHYQIVANANINMPNGNIYENTQQCWSFLTMASKWARYLGLVDPDSFVDRRNPEAIVYSPEYRQNPEPYISFSNYLYGSDFLVPTPADLPDLRELPQYPGPDSGGLEPVQAYLVEVWAEKTTMNDVLEPLCKRYGCNLVTGAGELSITAVRTFLKRARDLGKPARILYVSDFDPAGLGMPVSVARKVEFYQRNGSWEEQELDIQLQPIVLTEAQVQNYNLPRVPVKDSDMRKGRFEVAYGEGQVELDALEALYPGELEKIITKQIERYYDLELPEKVEETLGQLRTYARSVKDEVVEEHQSNLDDIQDDYKDVVEDYNRVRQDLLDTIQPTLDKLAEIQERANSVLGNLKNEWDAMRDDMEERLDLDNYENPEPYTPNDEDDDSLYDSRLDYMDQLRLYKRQKYGASVEE